MSGIFLALLCALCFAGIVFGAELWHFYRQLPKNRKYSLSQSLSTISKPKIRHKKRYLKFGVIVPDDMRIITALRDLELVHYNAGLRIFQPKNGHAFDCDE